MVNVVGKYYGKEEIDKIEKKFGTSIMKKVEIPIPSSIIKINNALLMTIVLGRYYLQFEEIPKKFKLKKDNKINKKIIEIIEKVNEDILTNHDLFLDFLRNEVPNFDEIWKYIKENSLKMFLISGGALSDVYLKTKGIVSKYPKNKNDIDIFYNEYYLKMSDKESFHLILFRKIMEINKNNYSINYLENRYGEFKLDSITQMEYGDYNIEFINLGTNRELYIFKKVINFSETFRCFFYYLDTLYAPELTLKDIENKIIRIQNAPTYESAIFRALRFKHEYGFEIEPMSMTILKVYAFKRYVRNAFIEPIILVSKNNNNNNPFSKTGKEYLMLHYNRIIKNIDTEKQIEKSPEKTEQKDINKIIEHIDEINYYFEHIEQIIAEQIEKLTNIFNLEFTKNVLNDFYELTSLDKTLEIDNPIDSYKKIIKERYYDIYNCEGNIYRGNKSFEEVQWQELIENFNRIDSYISKYYSLGNAYSLNHLLKNKETVLDLEHINNELRKNRKKKASKPFKLSATEKTKLLNYLINKKISYALEIEKDLPGNFYLRMKEIIFIINKYYNFQKSKIDKVNLLLFLIEKIENDDYKTDLFIQYLIMLLIMTDITQLSFDSYFKTLSKGEKKEFKKMIETNFNINMNDWNLIAKIFNELASRLLVIEVQQVISEDIIENYEKLCLMAIYKPFYTNETNILIFDNNLSSLMQKNFSLYFYLLKNEQNKYVISSIGDSSEFGLSSLLLHLTENILTDASTLFKKIETVKDGFIHPLISEFTKQYRAKILENEESIKYYIENRNKELEILNEEMSTYYEHRKII